MASRGFYSLAVFLVVVHANLGQDAKNDLDRLQGTWEVVEWIENGKPKADVIGKLKFVFLGDKLNVIHEGQPKNFGVKLNEKTTPKSFDWTDLDGNLKGEVNPCIYRFDGGKLQICAPHKTTTERPREFAAPKGSINALVTLKRAKK